MKRKDELESLPEGMSFDAQQAMVVEKKLVRVPCELERRFMDILHVILSDAWELPTNQ